MSTAEVPLKRTATGYVTRDGRFTVTRTTMGGGNAGGRWSEGHAAWDIEDTSGATPFATGFGGHRSSRTVDQLWGSPRRIAYAYKREAGQ